jgi:flagellar hook-basal body complex protein FliE
MISAISGLRAFGTEATRSVGPAAPAAGAAATPATDFSKVLADMATGTVDALKGGESAAIGGITGTKSVQQVVDAMLNAEQALQTAISVRDKLVSAYQEISRMTI